MRPLFFALLLGMVGADSQAWAETVRAAYPSANVQFLPAFVALDKGSSPHSAGSGADGAVAGGGARNEAEEKSYGVHGAEIRKRGRERAGTEVSCSLHQTEERSGTLWQR